MSRSLLPALALVFAATLEAHSDAPKKTSASQITEQLVERELALEARAMDLDKRAAELDRRAAELETKRVSAAGAPTSATSIPATKVAPPVPTISTPPGLPPETNDCATLVKREAARVAQLQEELRRLSHKLK